MVYDFSFKLASKNSWKQFQINGPANGTAFPLAHSKESVKWEEWFEQFILYPLCK